MSDYGVLDRALHKLVLDYPAVAEMSFTLDQALFGQKPAEMGRHVFVAGLARAGTTALMRRIHDTGQFRSLTYADMPFVLAPGFWRKVAGRRRAGPSGERAHGDGIIVDTQSPEGLEEVFWRTFDGPGYIQSDALTAHAPDAEKLALYRKFVAAVLRSGRQTRYLCKNNNNILRLPALATAFPDATILIPYRDPVAQAASLLRQHHRFREMQQDDPFVGQYMKWLVHHEFGADHRPFATHEASRRGPESLGYWLDQWIGVHRWLTQTAPPQTIWVRYEDLCDEPGTWQDIARRIGVDADGGGTIFQRSGQALPDPSAAPSELVEEARILYESLPRG